jgi:hypothetical protein
MSSVHEIVTDQLFQRIYDRRAKGDSMIAPTSFNVALYMMIAMAAMDIRGILSSAGAAIIIGRDLNTHYTKQVRTEALRYLVEMGLVTETTWRGKPAWRRGPNWS